MENLKKLKAREGTYDACILKEVKSVYSHLSVSGKKVLDIGGNIGASAVLFAEMGASEVITVEPEDDNYELLLENISAYADTIEPIKAAVVGDDSESVVLYLNQDGTNKAIHSTTPTRGRPGIEVSAINFMRLLEETKPEVVKIDCEGAEYDFLKAPLPEYVKQVVVELHLTRAAWRETEAPRVIGLFSGWEVVKAPKLEGKNWTTIASYKRP